MIGIPRTAEEGDILAANTQSFKQNQLLEFYEDKFSNADIPPQYSSPHLISLGSGLVNTDIMFVGQETNGWHGSWVDFQARGVRSQMEIYDRFMERRYPKKNTMFWRYLKETLGDTQIRPVWANLFKFDLGDARRPKNNVSKASKAELRPILEFHKGILAKEIEILQPKIVIFFTGHRYDSLFFDPIVKGECGDSTLLYRRVEELSGVDRWKCADMGLKNFEGFESFSGRAIRTYHPMYLNRSNESLRGPIRKYLKDEVLKVF